MSTETEELVDVDGLAAVVVHLAKRQLVALPCPVLLCRIPRSRFRISRFGFRISRSAFWVLELWVGRQVMWLPLRDAGCGMRDAGLVYGCVSEAWETWRMLLGMPSLAATIGFDLRPLMNSACVISPSPLASSARNTSYTSSFRGLELVVGVWGVVCSV